MATRPLLTATFWLDTLERTIRTVAQVAIGIFTVNKAPTPDDVDWTTTWWLLAVTAIGAVLFSVVASGIGEPGTASVLNPAPPDTLKDKGEVSVGLIVLIVVVILAFIGLAHLLGWSIG